MIENYLGIPIDYLVIGLAAIVIILIILVIVNSVKYTKLKKRLNKFMVGGNTKSLEDTLIYRLDQVDELLEANASNERNIDSIVKNMESCFQKYGLVKYDAFTGTGGKVSFSVCMLNEKNDGFILSAMHSAEGCYTYIKEIIDGNPIVNLSEEEEQALQRAIGDE